MDSRKIDALVAEHVMGGDLRPYSTVIQAAWAVVEKFPHLHLHKQGKPGHETWDCNIPLGDQYWFKPSHWVRARADTAPMAICLAALKAKGVFVDSK